MTQEDLPYNTCSQLLSTSICNWLYFLGCILPLRIGTAQIRKVVPPSMQHCCLLRGWALWKNEHCKLTVPGCQPAVLRCLQVSSPSRAVSGTVSLSVWCESPGLLLLQRTDGQSCWLSSNYLNLTLLQPKGVKWTSIPWQKVFFLKRHFGKK